MKTFGLIGYPLTHSFSQKFFSEKFKKENNLHTRYLNFPIEHVEGLIEIIEQHKDLYGLNVTIPHKEGVKIYLDELDEVAQSIGAVNTIKIYRNGEELKLKGFNTDAHGFYHSLKPFLNEKHRQALILGTGGSSKSVAYVFNRLEIPFTFVSRNPTDQGQLNYKQLSKEIIGKTQLIVNTSPVGMYPNIHSCPDIPYEYLSENHLLYDLIYNPEETLFLKKGREKGAQTLNGLSMLYLQAEKSWEIWNSTD